MENNRQRGETQRMKGEREGTKENKKSIKKGEREGGKRVERERREVVVGRIQLA